MSEIINNREMRQKTLKSIIKQLHEGKSVEEVKGEFENVFSGVSASEISEAETALIMEGIPVSEIQSLCDVHAAVFKGSIEEIHSMEQQEKEPSLIPGHPVNIFLKENRVLEEIIKTEIRPHLDQVSDPEHYKALTSGIEHLGKLELHYTKKENLIFPFMEKYDMAAPPKVMWGVDDEIRTQLDIAESMLKKSFANQEQMVKFIKELLTRIEEMIFKEENIMFPMLVEKLTEDEWKMIADDSEGFGYLVEDVPKWEPRKKAEVKKEIVKQEPAKMEEGIIQLPTGSFKLEELKCMLNTLPFDITFVDKNDEVSYFSEGKERIFARAKTVIGRNVSNCHPPTSVHMVEQIVADFKSGKKENEDFWIAMGERFVLIRYFAVRDEKGEYMGVLEVTQDITPIKALTGEKRLVSQ